MIQRQLTICSTFAALALIATPARAADKASGTFTVEGKTVRFAQVYATMEGDPARDDEKYVGGHRGARPGERRCEDAGATTALQLAEIYQRQDIAAALRKAGAR